MSSSPSPSPVTTALEARLRQLEAEVAAERKGRVRAEIALRTALNGQTVGGSLGYSTLTVGTVESPFHGRVGAPRQGMLAPDARAYVWLNPALSTDTVRGLSSFSHVYVLFLFNRNSSGHKVKAPVGASEDDSEETAVGKALRARPFHALVEAPALAGGRTGVFGTRSPHRPNVLGLSLCRLLGVRVVPEPQQGAAAGGGGGGGGERRSRVVLVLGGCDLIAGTAVVDVKPFAPYDCPTCMGDLVRGAGAAHAGDARGEGGCGACGGEEGGAAAAPSTSPASPFRPARDLSAADAALAAAADMTGDASSFSLSGPEWVYGTLRNQAAARLPVVWGPGTAEAVAEAVRTGESPFYGVGSKLAAGTEPDAAPLQRGGGQRTKKKAERERASARPGGGEDGEGEGEGEGGDAAADMDAEVAAALRALTQVLSHDIRALRHGRGQGAVSGAPGSGAGSGAGAGAGAEGASASSSDSTSSGSGGGGDGGGPVPAFGTPGSGQWYRFDFDAFHVEFTFRERESSGEGGEGNVAAAEGATKPVGAGGFLAARSYVHVERLTLLRLEPKEGKGAAGEDEGARAEVVEG
jgi:tRNA (adenine37-N6)-methyltransferase